MVSFCFYPHPTSLNHGCEAIAVSTANILRKWVPDAKATLLTKYERSSEQLGGDLAYDLYDRIEHLSMKMVTRWSKTWFLYQMTKLIGNDSPTRLIEKNSQKSTERFLRKTISSYQSAGTITVTAGLFRYMR